jgi:NTE family protein
MKNGKRVSLVLGSGGARGLAHIGVIHWLEENDFEISSIAGCSIGALIGGVYAAGQLDKLEEWVREITKLNIVSLLDFSWQKSGFVKGDKIINTLIELVGDKQIEELPIPYTAVATDLKGEKEVWMNSGPLFDAIRASISLPLFFTPFRHNQMDLIDGGVLNPVPIAPTFSDESDMTVAVNLGGMAEPDRDPPEERAAPSSHVSSAQEKVSRFIQQFQKKETSLGPIDLGPYDIANQAFDAMQSTIARQKLAAYPPDHVIEIARNACGILEFDRASEMIELGYNNTKEHFTLKGMA